MDMPQVVNPALGDSGSKARGPILLSQGATSRRRPGLRGEYAVLSAPGFPGPEPVAGLSRPLCLEGRHDE